MKLQRILKQTGETIRHILLLTLIANNPENMNGRQGSVCRRETFAFDRVLYRDNRIEVTPVLLLVGNSNKLFGAREIDVADISGVWRPSDKDTVLPCKPKWWRRAALRERVLVRAPRLRGPCNLIIDVRGQRDYKLELSVAEPDAVASAISDAQTIIY